MAINKDLGNVLDKKSLEILFNKQLRDIEYLIDEKFKRQLRRSLNPLNMINDSKSSSIVYIMLIHFVVI